MEQLTLDDEDEDDDTHLLVLEETEEAELL